MPSAESVARRLSALFALWGQTVEITHGGSATPVQARVTTLNLSVRAVYFSTTETAGWRHPAYQITIAGDYAALAVGDTVTLPNGASGLTVRGWDKTRLGNDVFRTVVFVAANA